MDLRSFIDQLRDIGELKHVEGADWDLEIGTITELMDERNGPGLLFDRIKGYPAGYRVAASLIATPRRMAVAFGLPSDTTNAELVRTLKDRFKDLKQVPPVYVKEGPVLENVREGKDVDLLQFPAPKWHEGDGGRYLGTGHMVVLKDPDEGWVNVATYRVQLHDSNTLGLFIVGGNQGNQIRKKYWAQGKSCPVAMAFGAHPLVWIPAFMAFPWGTPEYAITGGLMGQPLPVIAGEYTGLPVPAHAEIAIEGDCPPPEVESRPEGPFGEWPGYYGSGVRNEAVVKVKRVMYRNNPIINGSPPLKPPATGNARYLLRAANVWHELERLGIPGVKCVWNMRAGGSRYWTVVSIEQKYAGHAMQSGMAATSGIEGANHSRFVVVVDDDIDATNYEDVLWAMATRCDPASSIQVINGCWSTPLDPTIPPERRAKGDITNSRAIFLAVRPYHWRKDFPKVNRASDELRSRTIQKWRHLFDDHTKAR
ncbi:MAG: UbiD family decarboxylase [Chloroflexi bacterium]|nr:UbiD family decarboxylase [Chloroflexota bacterium]